MTKINRNKSALFFGFMLLALLFTMHGCKKEKELPTIIYPPTIAIEEGTAEPNSANITLTLSSVSGDTVDAYFRIHSGTAFYGLDYLCDTIVNLTWLPGETEKQVNLLLVNDSIVEEDEIFSFVIAGITNANFKYGSCDITIKNDD